MKIVVAKCSQNTVLQYIIQSPNIPHLLKSLHLRIMQAYVLGLIFSCYGVAHGALYKPGEPGEDSLPTLYA